MADQLPDLYPFRTEPVYRYYVWGGTRLSQLMGKPTGPEGTLAESWEISDDSTVAEGAWQGKTLREVDEVTGGGISNGARHYPNARLPLLIKLSGSAQDVSVQIHPNDEQALRDDPERGYPGKTEMYVILDAEPGAGVYWGVRADVSDEELREACKTGAGVAGRLNFVPVKAGDVLFSPSGVVHALGKGIVFCEVQQNSDITYRLYDWGRAGVDGKPRPLHLEQGMAVLDRSKQRSAPTMPLPCAATPPGTRRTILCACPYFVVELLELESEQGARLSASDADPGRTALRGTGITAAIELRRARPSMRGIVVLEGNVTLSAGGVVATAAKGQSVVVPAALPNAAAGTAGRARLLFVYEPDLAADVVEPLRREGYTGQQIAQLGDLGG